MDYGYLDMSSFNLIKEVSVEERLVLLLARWVVHGQGLPEIRDLSMQEPLEWEKFNKILAYHELFPLAYSCFKKSAYFLPNREMELLEKSYYFCVAYLSYLWQEFTQIAHIFSDRNIKFMPLKGVAFLVDNMYTDKSYLRPMCDIDLLIRKEELPLVENTLVTLGYEKYLCGRKEDYWKEKNYHIIFIRKRRKDLSYIVEIHWSLDYKRDKPILPYLWSRIRKSQVNGKDIYLLSPEDTLFSLALHQRRFGKILSIKNVSDVAMVLHKYKDTLDWDYILREAEAGQMRTTLYFILAQADILLNIKTPFFVPRTLDIPRCKRRLIERFILQDAFLSNLSLNNVKTNINNSYLKSHFLIYDNFWEPVKYILNIPQEQFAKFYGLDTYSKKTNLLYRTRYFYFICNLFLIIIKTLTKRISKFFKKLCQNVT